MQHNESSEVAVFGGGCFWCTEAVFQMLKGIIAVEPGYAGGTTQNPTYEEVCNGRSGHAEVIQVTYDPKVIAYTDLLAVFFGTHDPTTVNRQGHDVGTQYRSIILTSSADQQQEAQKFVKELNASNSHGAPIVTEVRRLDEFFPAEGYHHSYYQNNQNNGYCQSVINPKLQKAKERFKELLAKQE